MAAVAAADSAAEATAATAVAAATEAAAATKGAGATEGAAATAPSADAQQGASSFPDSDVDDVDDNVAVGGVGGRPPHKVIVVVGGSALSTKRPPRPLPSDDDVVDVGGCGRHENDDVSPPSAFPIPIPASGGYVGGNVGGSGNNNNSNTNSTNLNKSVRRRRKMYSVEYLCSFSNKFISYVASYVGPIQTGFLRGF
jgi:hypothetical protein